MRSAVYAGLVSLVPVVCWLLLELRSVPLPALAPPALSALASVHALAIALWIPLLPPAPAGDSLLASSLLALVPAPVGALLWLSGAVSAAAVARTQLALLAIALLVAVLVQLAARGRRFEPLLRAALAVALMTLLWQLHPPWLEPLLT